MMPLPPGPSLWLLLVKGVAAICVAALLGVCGFFAWALGSWLVAKDEDEHY